MKNKTPLMLEPLSVLNAISLYMLQQRNTNETLFTRRDFCSILHVLEYDSCLGLFDFNKLTKEKKLVAYSIVVTAKKIEKQLLGLGAKDHNIARLAGTVVDKEYQGRGLQRFLLKEQISKYKAKGFSGVMSLVHEDNKASFENMEMLGFSYLKTQFIPFKDSERAIFFKQL